MDRRRYVPSLDDLDVRELLSAAVPATLVPTAVTTPAPVTTAVPVTTTAATATPTTTAASPTTTTTTPTTTTPATPTAAEIAALTPAVATPPIKVHQIATEIQPLRNQRIERLPALLYSLDPQRHVPPQVTENIQYDLAVIKNTLTPPPTSVLTTFNHQLRSLISGTNITTADMHGINAAFGAVLRNSSATPEMVTKFQNDMAELAKVDVHQRDPAPLLANDYSLITQLCMGIGINIEVVPTAAEERTYIRDQIRLAHRTALQGNLLPKR